jgi:hypothetical protein
MGTLGNCGKTPYGWLNEVASSICQFSNELTIQVANNIKPVDLDI